MDADADADEAAVVATPAAAEVAVVVTPAAAEVAVVKKLPIILTLLVVG